MPGARASNLAISMRYAPDGTLGCRYAGLSSDTGNVNYLALSNITSVTMMKNFALSALAVTGVGFVLLISGTFHQFLAYLQ